MSSYNIKPIQDITIIVNGCIEYALSEYKSGPATKPTLYALASSFSDTKSYKRKEHNKVQINGPVTEFLGVANSSIVEIHGEDFFTKFNIYAGKKILFKDLALSVLSSKPSWSYDEKPIFFEDLLVSEGAELDRIGEMYGLFRNEGSSGVYTPEDDTDFRSRILKALSPNNGIKIPCPHNWVESFGLFNKYVDCSLCGAKKEEING